MNVLDENIPEDQRQLLRSWRIRAYQIGQDIARPGLEDEQQIIPSLLKLRRPTLFTRDLGFFHPELRHAKYCLACLSIAADESATFIRRILRHSQSKAARANDRGAQQHVVEFLGEASSLHVAARGLFAEFDQPQDLFGQSVADTSDRSDRSAANEAVNHGTDDVIENVMG